MKPNAEFGFFGMSEMSLENKKNRIDLRFLKECEVLSGLSEEILRVVFSRGQIVRIEPGGFIFNSGEQSDRFFVIITVIVEICREDEPGKYRALAYLGS